MAWGIQINLEGEGYDVAVAQSGQAALELHRSFRPELILLDLKLPDIHGLEGLRRIRVIDPTVRVLIVSCLIEPEQRASGFNTGANDYQIKPFTISELLGRVQRQLKHARLLAERREWEGHTSGRQPQSPRSRSGESHGTIPLPCHRACRQAVRVTQPPC